jgi:hypothetical protein
VHLYQRSADRRPDPEPLRTDDRVVVIAGIVIWSLLLGGFVLARGTLAEQGRGWWVWTPVVGIALGLLGLRYLSRTSRRR